MDFLGAVALSVVVIGAVLAAASPDFPDKSPQDYYCRKARQFAHRSRVGALWYRSRIASKYKHGRHKGESP